MASKVIYSVVAIAGIAAASGAAWWYQQPKSQAATAAPANAPLAGVSGKPAARAGADKPVVEAVRVEVMRMTDDTQAVGSLRSRRGVVIRPEVSGRITQLNFSDGQRVRKGQVLVQFDDQLPRAQIQQSQAELSIAHANQKRNQELVAQNFVSQRSLDESAASLQVAQAKLSLSQATAQRLKIVAPFDGIAGIRQVNVGDYLKDGSDIVNIEDIEAIYVDFRLPERFQSKIRRGQTATLDIDALPGRQYTAQIQAIDPLIDANGRSVGVRGCIDNRQLQLRPGMFARVNTVFSVRNDARVVPEEAIVPQGGRQFVIKLLDGPDANSRTTQRVEVKVGVRSPGRVEILQGLEPGDLVVRAGQQRLQRDGTVVSLLEPAGATTPAAAGPAPGTAADAGAGAGARPVSAQAAPAKAGTASGGNPCGPVIADAGSALVPAVSAPPATAPGKDAAPHGAAGLSRSPA